ncbi:uncharacterized protein PpBr36_11296 [Pyricularia pennisetigena]|uniref:uncharacterized protein n=1 Tax=Pyricularia pennisetigena TaxID=1578925 RepID=UPI0011533203|nr:uncharacterized protein PpBr36_11296 [Pyricularia pennisetigena]TLS20586.1 hypothetical protein PpBr36_11296 [Pyricularia pennisetigena]
MPMSDVPASKQGTSPRLENPPRATSPPVHWHKNPDWRPADRRDLFESYKVLWDQNQMLESKLSAALDANTQLRDSISTNEALKAALEFELKEMENENAAFNEWHCQEIQDKDVEIAMLEEELKVLREQGEQSGMNVPIPKA